MFKHYLQLLLLIAPLAIANYQPLSITQLTEKAKQSDAIAQVQLGTAYHFGQSKEFVAKDYEKALYWYRKSAEQDNPIAYFQLGQMYRFGRGVEVDEKQAFSHYLRAAELGESSSFFDVGMAYYDGWGVAKDDKKAFYWIQKSAEHGYHYNLLGMFYYHGIGTARNAKKAFDNFTKAIHQSPNNAELQEQLGIMYEFGYGTPPDLNQAFHFYLKARKKGKQYSAYRLAEFYQQGIVVAKNIELAEAYYQLACKKGIKQACDSK